MLRIIFNWRYWVLLAIGCIALIGIFGFPEEYEGFAWCVAFIISKVIGFYFGYLYFRLFTYWSDRNEIIELSKFVNDMEE